MTRTPTLRAALAAVALAAIASQRARRRRSPTGTPRPARSSSSPSSARRPPSASMAIVQTAVLEAVNAAAKRQPARRRGRRRRRGGRQPRHAAQAAAARRRRSIAARPTQAALAKVRRRRGQEPPASRPASRPPPPCWPRAPTTALPRAERYRPHATAGAYVPTAGVAAPQWPQRKPWLMASAAQFRPAPPPALTSAHWARDYNEVKALGGKASTRRTRRADRDRALLGVLAAADLPRRAALGGAGSPAATWRRTRACSPPPSQAMDDALIAVFDAKYHYNFWRPVTAIRNGDLDGNDATEREAALGAADRQPDAPRVPERAQHPGRRGRRRAEGRGRPRRCRS